jgi:hypothetical protein
MVFQGLVGSQPLIGDWLTKDACYHVILVLTTDVQDGVFKNNESRSLIG